MRLDLDVKRRAFAAQAAKMEGKGKAEEGNQKAAREAEKMEFKKQTESDKTVHTIRGEEYAASFLPRHASGVVQMVVVVAVMVVVEAVLGEYAAASIIVMQKCFETSYLAFDLDTPASLSFTHTA
eukprot:gene9679-8507_t